MTVTLGNLSDFGYTVENGQYLLTLGEGNDDVNMTGQWHKMTGTLNTFGPETGATLQINAVPAPNASNFNYRIESDYQLFGGENHPRFKLFAKDNSIGIQKLFAFIGTDDDEFSKTIFAGTETAISDGVELYFAVINNTFKFFYYPKS